MSINEKDLIESAVKKVQDPAQKDGCNDKRAVCMYSSVVKALESFCRQNVEFSEAVLQTKKTVGELVDSIGKDIKGNSISDIEVYRKIAELYFPGCVVEFEMKLYMSKYEKTEPVVVPTEQPKKAVSLNLFDLL